MNRVVPGLAGKYGQRAMVGNGGLLEDSIAAMVRYGAACFPTVGGAASLATRQIEAIERV